MDEFLKFYSVSAGRLSAKLASYNRGLKKDGNALLRPFRKDLADLNEGGKLVRGVLVNLGYHLCGHEDCTASDDAALAFEIFQTGILIHDDIIDRADRRRGRKTMHVRYREELERRGIRPVSRADTVTGISSSAALCSGDFMIYEANRYLAEAYAGNENLAALISEFDGIVLDTIRGELLDIVLPYELADPDLPRAQAEKLLSRSVFEIYHLKSSLYSVVGPLHLGMLLGGASPAERKAVDSFSDDIGIAFQIKDDLMGIYADAEVLGKDVGSDISEFKQTILYAYVKQKDDDFCRALFKYYGRAQIGQKDLAAVRKIFADSGAKAYAEKQMEACFQKAGRKLAKMEFLPEEDRKILADFIVYNANRKK